MSGTVSVIVPVYNVEPYLRQCVDSVLAQTYGDLEVILVNDGSPDGCGKICDDYAARDGRVKVIHQTNRGLSGARNSGIGAAAGDYLFFIDSDDWIEPHTIEALHRDLTENGAGMAVGGIISVYGDGNRVPAFTWDGMLCMGAGEAVGQLCRRDIFSVSAWGKLYKRELFNIIRYPEGKLAEDTAIIIDLLIAAKTVTVRAAPFYNYRQRRSGIVHGKKRHQNSAAHGMEAWERNARLIGERFPSLTGAAVSFYWYTCVSTAVIASHGQKYRRDPAFQTARAVVKSNYREIRKSPFLTKKEKFLAALLRYSPPLFRLVFVITARRRKKEPLYD